MKQRNDRWMILRFAFGCGFRSSVALDAPSNPASHDAQSSRPNHDAQTSTQDNRQADSRIVKKAKHPLGFRLPKTNLSHGFRRLITRLRSVSRIFVYKIEMDEDDDDEGEDEGEMEIGFPTDVKHLTHIGWDGSNSTTVTKSINKDWENLTPSEKISFPSISLKQFEDAMAQQAAATFVDSNT